MVVDKHTVIGLQEDEIRIDFIREVCKALANLQAFSSAEIEKVNKMAEIFAEEMEELKGVI